jgi:hypothetical protein
MATAEWETYVLTGRFKPGKTKYKAILKTDHFNEIEY